MADDTYSEEETVARREAMLRRMLSTPKPSRSEKPAKQRDRQPK